MCMKMMNDGGWAQQLGGHACPRHRSHLCRHSSHRLRRLGAASTRSRWKAALVDRWCWFSGTGAIFWKPVRLPMAAGPGGAVDTQEPSAEGSRPARKLVTTRANNVPKRGSSAIIFTAFPFGTCTPEGTPHIPVEPKLRCGSQEIPGPVGSRIGSQPGRTAAAPLGPTGLRHRVPSSLDGPSSTLTRPR